MDQTKGRDARLNRETASYKQLCLAVQDQIHSHTDRGLRPESDDSGDGERAQGNSRQLLGELLNRLILLLLDGDSELGINREWVIVLQGHFAFGDTVLDAECELSVDGEVCMDSTLGALDRVNASGACQVESITDPKHLGGSVGRRFSRKVFVKLEVIVVGVVEWDPKGHCDQLGRNNTQFNDRRGNRPYNCNSSLEVIRNSLNTSQYSIKE